MAYKQLIRPLLFMLPPELAHNLTFKMLELARKLLPLFRWSYGYHSPGLTRDYVGIHFPNPIGLSAGLDKDCVLADYWGYLGFGFVECGTTTFGAQPGNPLPRLFRYPEQEALLNRMGFNSPGAEVVAAKMAKHRLNVRPHVIPIGLNIGKTKEVPLDRAHEDYSKSLRLLYPFADYFTINVSSPNTPGLRELQKKDNLKLLLSEILKTSEELAVTYKEKPIFLKISPDLTEKQLDDIIEVSLSTGIRGIVATNTSTDITLPGVKNSEEGGLSGKPLLGKSTEILGLLRKKLPSDFLLIGSGGISDERSIKEKFDAGANLVQIYTAYIYEGPWIVRRLLRTLC